MNQRKKVPVDHFTITRVEIPLEDAYIPPMEVLLRSRAGMTIAILYQDDPDKVAKIRRCRNDIDRLISVL